MATDKSDRYRGKHLGNSILKMIVEMANEIDVIQKKDMEKYIKDRKSGRVFFIQKPDGNVLTFNERKIGDVVNPSHIIEYFIFVLNINVKKDGYLLVNPDGDILNWDSFEDLNPGVLYKVVHIENYIKNYT